MRIEIQNCDTCLHSSVCRHKDEYKKECEQITRYIAYQENTSVRDVLKRKRVIGKRDTAIDVYCSEFTRRSVMGFGE